MVFIGEPRQWAKPLQAKTYATVHLRKTFILIGTVAQTGLILRKTWLQDAPLVVFDELVIYLHFTKIYVFLFIGDGALFVTFELPIK